MLGHVNDPRMNTEEKDFGILISSADSKTGRPRCIIYLKDDVSRFYTQGTPVTFELQTRKITYDKPTVITTNKEKNYKAIDDLLNKDLRLIEIEVATKVRAIEADLEFHPVVKGLNRMVKEILTDSVEYINLTELEALELESKSPY
jgi:hypothetical protein